MHILHKFIISFEVIKFIILVYVIRNLGCTFNFFNMQRHDFPRSISFPDEEIEILKFWKKEEVFLVSLKQSIGKPRLDLIKCIVHYFTIHLFC